MFVKEIYYQYRQKDTLLHYTQKFQKLYTLPILQRFYFEIDSFFCKPGVL